jgi:tetratricopeptide (TPR) repeat protein
MRRLFPFVLYFLLISNSVNAAGSNSGSPTSSTSSAENSYGSDGGADLNAKVDPLRKAKRLIYKEKYAEAYILLSTLETPKIEDDRQNLMGFTARKSGDYGAAKKHYAAALKITPKHVGALEYQGELFITLGDLNEAEQNLKKINSICWLYCKEKKMLENALKEARKN